MSTTITAPAEAPTLSELAGYCYDWFERFTRDGDETVIYKLRDGAPEWIREDMIFPAHGDMLPDDHKYEMIVTLLGAIHDSGAEDDEAFSYNGSDHDACESCVSDYTHDRYAWLSSNLSRAGYIEEFYDEFGGEGSTDPGELAARGWYMEAREVLSYVLSALCERLELIRDEMPCMDEMAFESGSRYPLPEDFAGVASPHAPRLTRSRARRRRALSAERAYQEALARWTEESGYGDALAEWREEFPEVAVIEASR